jgi:hypothetical protein
VPCPQITSPYDGHHRLVCQALINNTSILNAGWCLPVLNAPSPDTAGSEVAVQMWRGMVHSVQNESA